jgi:hypothetical protein
VKPGSCSAPTSRPWEHWVAGALPEQATRGYLAEALTRLHRIVTHGDLAFPPPGTGGDESIGLSLDADPVPVLAQMWRAESDRRGFTATSAYSVAAALLPLEQVIDIAARTARIRSGAIAGRAEVAAVRDMISAFTEMDERHGGQHGRTVLPQYMLDDVAPLCRGRFRTEADRIQMLSAASRGVHLVGWKAYDNGQQHGLAQRYYLQSYALAVEAGLRGQDGFVLQTMAMQNMSSAVPGRCSASSMLTPWPRPDNDGKPSPKLSARGTRSTLTAATTLRSGRWPGARRPLLFTLAPPRSLKPWVTVAVLPTSTLAPPPAGPYPPSPASSPWN